MARVPDRLMIDRADRELFDHDAIKSEIFAGMENKEQFLFAMAVGFKNQVSRRLDSRDGFVLVQVLHPEDEALIDAVAMHVKGPDQLSDREAVFRIAEEYAHAGIRLLYDQATSGQPGSFHKRLEVELFSLAQNLDSA